jgi:Protein kinase domain
VTSTSPNTPDAAPEVTLSDNGVSTLLQQRLLDPPSAPGQLASLDGYDILRTVGVGGMGLVFLAREVRNERLVAVKVIQPDLVSDQRSMRRFLIEARHMQQLSHPNILRVLDIQDRSEGPYFVTPYMQRGSLSGLLQVGQTLETETVLRIAGQVGEALRHAHSRGILHRDLKPANILLDEAGDAYLADFGLLRRFYDDSIVDASRARVEGTAPYLSPVAASGRAEDTRGDIYAWGALVYEMLTGSPPYTGETSGEIIDRVLEGPPIPIIDRNTDAPAGLVSIVEGAMARELRDRYATMEDVLTDLDRLTKGQEPLGPNGHAGRRSIRRRSAWFWMLVGLVLVTLGTLGVLVSPTIKSLVMTPDTNPELNTGYIAPMPGVDTRTTPVQKLLFEDRFTGGRIDPELWRWGQKDFSYKGLGDGNHGQVSQRNGTLLLTVTSKSVSGWSSGRSVWIDALTDLKVGTDVAVRARYAVSGKRGNAQILIEGSVDQSRPDDEPALIALEHKADEYHVLDDSPETLDLYFHAASNSALVNTTTSNSSPSYRLIDLSDLEQWHLRFMVTSATSQDFSDGEMHFRLKQMQAYLSRPFACVYGRVLDIDTGLPIRDVSVAGPEGQTCSVDKRGMYLLPIRPEQQVLLQITDARFDVVKDAPIAYAELGQQVQLDIYVRRAPARYGDKVQTLTLPGHDVLSAVDAGMDDVVFVAGGGNRSAIYHMDAGAESISEPRRFPDVTGLVRVGDLIYGVSHWPGQLYRFEEGSTSPHVSRLATLWPRGLGYDGEYLWTLNAGQTDNRYEVWALDPATGSVVHRFSTADTGVRSITYGNDHLWIGSRSGVVYEVDPQKAISSGSLEDAVVNQFNGVYECLSFSEASGELWAIDSQGKNFVRINISEEP